MAKTGKPRITKRNTGGSAKGAARMQVLITSDTITPNLAKLPKFVDKAIGTTMAFHEPQAENYAKKNAPWNDQTTNARNGLRAASGKEGETHFMVLAHQVPYGIFLETRWAGRLRIIMPTIEIYGVKIMGTLEKILDRFR